MIIRARRVCHTSGLSSQATLGQVAAKRSGQVLRGGELVNGSNGKETIKDDKTVKDG